MRKFPQGTLAKNTLWALSGQGFRLLVQAAYFTVIARSLGSVNYGAFISVAALVGIASPFGAFGSGNLLIRDVARRRDSFQVSWGTAIARTLFFGSLLTVLVTFCAHFALPNIIPQRVVLLVAVSDIIGLNLTLISSYAFQAVEQLNWGATISAAISVSRLFAAVLLIFHAPHPTTLQWSYAYLASTLLVLFGSCLLVAIRLGLPELDVRSVRSELHEGLFFAAGMSAQTVYNDLDKTMLARLGSLQATGIYGAAYRIIEVGFTPVWSLLAAAYPSFFRVGLEGIEASIAFAKPLLRKAFLFSCLLCLGIMVCAGLLPMVLGKQYLEAAQALRWLALILPIRSIHAFFSDVLTSVGRQGLRTLLQLGVALVNALANLWLIPAFAWKGAAWSSVGCDALLAIAVLSALRVLSRQQTELSPLPLNTVERN